MHEMHEHVTCKYKYIRGSAQPKPTSIQHCNKVNTHLNAWNIVIMQMWCNAWSFKTILVKPNPKILRKTHQFWKIPNFQHKPIKLGQKCVMHDEWVKMRHTWSREGTQRPKNMWVGGLEWEREVLGGEKIEWVERDREKWS